MMKCSLMSELEKLRSVQERSQAIGDFLGWLGEQGIFLCRSQERGFYPIPETTEQLLAKYFNIDLNKVEQEKRAILERLGGEQA